MNLRTFSHMILILCTIFYTVFAHSSYEEILPDTITGFPRVIDGDTLNIEGKRIRFHAIDAPESTQTCFQDKIPLPCGNIATRALEKKIGSRKVSCEKKKHDRYGRIIAACTVDSEDIEAWMVRNGYAVAYRKYSKKYIKEEEKASANNIGIWGTDFLMPWEWRKIKISNYH